MISIYDAMSTLRRVDFGDDDDSDATEDYGEIDAEVEAASSAHASLEATSPTVDTWKFSPAAAIPRFVLQEWFGHNATMMAGKPLKEMVFSFRHGTFMLVFSDMMVRVRVDPDWEAVSHEDSALQDMELSTLKLIGSGGGFMFEFSVARPIFKHFILAMMRMGTPRFRCTYAVGFLHSAESLIHLL